MSIHVLLAVAEAVGLLRTKEIEFFFLSHFFWIFHPTKYMAHKAQNFCGQVVNIATIGIIVILS